VNAIETMDPAILTGLQNQISEGLRHNHDTAKPIALRLDRTQLGVISYALTWYGAANREALNGEKPAPSAPVPPEAMEAARSMFELLVKLQPEHREKVIASVCCLALDGCAGNIIT